MIITIDIGNTNTKIAVFDRTEMVCSLRLSSQANRTSDEFGTDIVALLARQGVSPADITDAVIASVIPSLNYTFGNVCQNYLGLKPLFVSAQTAPMLDICYQPKDSLGADRIADSVAAFNEYGAPLIVVDCGTATTFNIVGEGCRFLGGAITFGLRSGAEALSASAAALPKIPLTTPDSLIATSTIGGMQSGIVFGFVGLVESMIARFKKQDGLANARVIATGGLSTIVCQLSTCIDIVDRTLTLKGLRDIAYAQKTAEYL